MLYLIYINRSGSDFTGNYVYEFIFTDNLQDVDGDEWGSYPAAGRPSPPESKYIKKVGKLETKLKLDVVQDSSIFSVWDAVDGIIATAWENIEGYDEYPKKRMCFGYGITMDEVEVRLYERDLVLKFTK